MTVANGWDPVAWVQEAVQEKTYDAWGWAENAATVPYIVVYDIESHMGSDKEDLLTRHELTIYRYTSDGTRNRRLDALLQVNGLKYNYEKDIIENGITIEERYDVTSTVTERRLA